MSDSMKDEVNNLLDQLKLSIIKDDPVDLVKYGMDYFEKLYQEKMGKENDGISNTRSLSVSDDELSDNYNEDMTDREEKLMLQRISDIARPTIVGEKFDPSLFETAEECETHQIFTKSIEQFKNIKDKLKSVFLFKTLDQDSLEKVIECMFPAEFEAGDIVMRENDPGDNFYLIDTGSFHATSLDGKISEFYDNEGSFGELALMYNVPRKATIKATSYGKLWAIDRKSFQELVLKNAYEKRKRLNKFMSKVKLFQNLSEYDKSNLADALKTRELKNEYVVKEGEKGDSMFFIDEGEVIVTKKDEDIEKELRRLYPGDYFGEVAIICAIPRIASVYCVGSVKLHELEIETYNRLMGPCANEMKDKLQEYNFSQV